MDSTILGNMVFQVKREEPEGRVFKENQIKTQDKYGEVREKLDNE